MFALGLSRSNLTLKFDTNGANDTVKAVGERQMHDLISAIQLMAMARLIAPFSDIQNMTGLLKLAEWTTQLPMGHCLGASSGALGMYSLTCEWSQRIQRHNLLHT